MGPSLMVRGPAARAGLAVRGRVDLVVPGDRVDLDRVVRGLAVLVGLAVRGLVDLVVRHPAGRADIRDRAGLAVRDRVDPVDPVGPADLDLVVRADLDRVDPADIKDRAGRVDPAGLADRDLAGREDLADLAGREDLMARQCVDLRGRGDRHQRRIRPGVLSTGVAPRWAAPGMCRTASARPATVRRLRRYNTDGPGMAGLRPERRRLSGTGRRPRVAGTVHRLPVVGTAHGTVRRAISQSRSVISGRSITTGTTRSRSLTRFLGDGASGSSVSGSRCTDTT
jgi:hypothetical protein